MSSPNIKIAIAPSSRELTAEATNLAKKLRIPLAVIDDQNFPCLLAVTEERLELRLSENRKMGPIFVDFAEGKADYRRRKGGGRKQTIVRAVGMKGKYIPSVFDATAGLGRDAFVLACEGCKVMMCEQNLVLAALLADGLARAKEHAHLLEIINKNIIFQVGNSLDIMKGLTSARPDAVYLDPMFPHRSKSALVKKEMQILQELIGEDLDGEQLLKQALKTATRRVVVKRPAPAPPLNGPKPDIEYRTKKNRFDIYLIHS